VWFHLLLTLMWRQHLCLVLLNSTGMFYSTYNALSPGILIRQRHLRKWFTRILECSFYIWHLSYTGSKDRIFFIVTLVFYWELFRCFLLQNRCWWVILACVSLYDWNESLLRARWLHWQSGWCSCSLLVQPSIVCIIINHLTIFD